MSFQLDAYQMQMSDFLAREGLGDRYFAKIKQCTNLQQIFKALCDSEAEHFAVLCQDELPVLNSFEVIKEMLAKNDVVPLALIYQKSA